MNARLRVRMTAAAFCLFFSSFAVFFFLCFVFYVTPPLALIKAHIHPHGIILTSLSNVTAVFLHSQIHYVFNKLLCC